MLIPAISVVKKCEVLFLPRGLNVLGPPFFGFLLDVAAMWAGLGTNSGYMLQNLRNDLN